MILFFIHSELVFPFVIAMYALAVLGWTLICYLVIKAWLKRKKKK